MNKGGSRGGNRGLFAVLVVFVAVAIALYIMGSQRMGKLSTMRYDNVAIAIEGDCVWVYQNGDRNDTLASLVMDNGYALQGSTIIYTDEAGNTQPVAMAGNVLRVDTSRSFIENSKGCHGGLDEHIVTIVQK